MAPLTMWIADLEALGDEELVRRFVSDGLSDAVEERG